MSAPSDKGKSRPVDLTPYSPRVPGLIRFKKIPATPDFTNAFDFEEAIASVFTEYIVDDKGRKSIKAIPIYLVDPGQGGLSPLRTLTLLPAEGPAAIDITNAQALDFVQHRLKRLGVDRALARAGAREGDVVHIGGFTFEYEPDR